MVRRRVVIESGFHKKNKLAQKQTKNQQICSKYFCPSVSGKQEPF